MCVTTQNCYQHTHTLLRATMTSFQGAAKQKKPTDMVGSNCYYADVDVKVTDQKLVVQSSSFAIPGFALLSKTYKEKSLSETQIKEQEQEKQKLADEASQLSVLVTRKQLTIVGWSPNLLQNSSGQVRLFISIYHKKSFGNAFIC